MNNFKVCVTKLRKQILCFVRDEYNEIMYETMVDFNLENIMCGDIIQFSSDKDVEMYTRDFTESEIDMISQKEMLEILLEQNKGE